MELDEGSLTFNANPQEVEKIHAFVLSRHNNISVIIWQSHLMFKRAKNREMIIATVCFGNTILTNLSYD